MYSDEFDEPGNAFHRVNFVMQSELCQAALRPIPLKASDRAKEYLDRRAKCRDAKSKVGESLPVIELQSIKTSATCQHAPAIAKKWLPEAQFEAIESDAES
jgi:hypothetical protein